MPDQIEWYNINANRAYPFGEDENLTSVEEAVLPNDLVVDMSILCRYGVTAEPVKLLNWSVTPVSHTFIFGRGATPVGYCMATNSGDDPAYRTFKIQPINNLATGFMVLYRMGGLTPAQNHFTSGIPVEPKAVRMTRGSVVTSIGKLASQTSLSGVVNLSFDQKLMAATVTGSAGTFTVALSLIRGTDFATKCQACSQAGTCGSNPLRTINSVPADGADTLKLYGCVTGSDLLTAGDGTSTGKLTTALTRATLCANRARRLPDSSGVVPPY